MKKFLTEVLLTTAVCAIALCSTTAIASEIIVQNDSIPAAGSGTPLVAFLANEQAGEWLTSPITGDIVGLQVLWASQFTGAPDSQEFAIHVYDAGVFPAPAALLASVTAPVLVDGVINEFRFLDPSADNIPLQVPIAAKQSFVVAIEFLNQQNMGSPFAPSVEYDADGCLAGKNSVFAIPGGWIDGCSVGVPDDFGIRAIVSPCPQRATYGDFNCDTYVGLLDLDILGANWGALAATYDQGDSNNDGQVGLLDLNTLGINWGTTTPIPEPTSLMFSVLGGLAMIRRR